MSIVPLAAVRWSTELEEHPKTTKNAAVVGMAETLVSPPLGTCLEGFECELTISEGVKIICGNEVYDGGWYCANGVCISNEIY